MRLIMIALFLFSSIAALAQNTRGYYRFPTIHGSTILFTAEGDLWQTGLDGGTARRITTHPGEETRAALSPDGKTLAFTANYEGPAEVYTMPASGGLPTRRTYDGGVANVAGWTPEGKILYTTTRFSTLPNTQLVTIDAQNRIDPLPLSQASQGCYVPSGKTLFFTRLAFQGSNAQRYKGGTAQNLWKFNGSSEAVPLTADYAGTSKDAMCWNGRVYFASDRDGTMNIWSMDENGNGLKQHTKHQGWDIKSPALNGGRIVYQMGADLHLYDIASGVDKALAIDLPSDFDHLREHWIKNPAEFLTSVHLSHDGGSVVLTARGHVFSAPAKQGRMVTATAGKPGRFRNARMMADGKSLVALSSESGEVELWKLPAGGGGAAERLTNDGKVLRWDAIPSPDGKWIVHQDKDNQLWMLNLETKAQSRVAASEFDSSSMPNFGSVRWSPDSRWISFHKSAKNGFDQVYILNIQTSALTAVTTDRYNSTSAAWSMDGKWLYLLSDRSLKSLVTAPWGPRQPEPFFDKTFKVYQIALKKDLRSPFQPADELHPESSATPAKTATEKVQVDIDLDGIAARLEEVPAPPGNYRELTASAKRLCWISGERGNAEKSALECLDIANKGDKPEQVMEGVNNYELSADGKKLMMRKLNEIYITDSAVKATALNTPKALADARLDLRDWTFSVIPSQEFREAFFDAWRLHRDYFYDRKMHGVNWTQMRDKYGELVGRVRDRSELSDLLAHLISELSALHASVTGGDLRKGPDQVQPASLGARLLRDQAAGGYLVEHIYRSDPDRPDLASPLAKEVADGDLILSLNGREVLTAADPGELLRNQAGKQVLLRVRGKGKTEPREVIVKPLGSLADADLRYHEWEYTRRLETDKASNEKIGYLHLRATGPNDINQWAEHYYPVFDREGLIIDVRHNRGGNIDSWLLDRLMRKAWMYWQNRSGIPTWNMQSAFRGHMVVLCDENTGSDGEAFAEGFKRLGLGKVIGKRTWGGEIWLTGTNRLVDSGIATAAENGVFGPEGKWLIEGHGVEPDVVVDNLPFATFGGKDAQLEAAIKHLQALIKVKPVVVPSTPLYPDKSFKP